MRNGMRSEEVGDMLGLSIRDISAAMHSIVSLVTRFSCTSFPPSSQTFYHSVFDIIYHNNP